MNDRELIDAVIDGTLPKIKDIRDNFAAQAEKELDEQIAAGKWPELAGLPKTPPDPALHEALVRSLYGAPLTDLAIQFLWSILSKATSGEFVVDEASVAAVSATLDDLEIKRATGFDQAHVRPIKDKMAEAIVEVVRARGTIEIMIDRQPVRLVAKT